MSDKILFCIREVADFTTIKRSTIYSLIEKGMFPLPRRVGERMVRWHREDLLHWMSNLPVVEDKITREPLND